jgi:hypothetical protein
VEGTCAWAPIAAPPDAVKTLTAGDSPDTIYAGAANRGVLRSDDGGHTWQVSDAHLRATAVTALAVDPTDSASEQRLFAGTGSGEVWRSVDGGQHWSEVDRGLPEAGVPLLLALDPLSPETRPPTSTAS